MSHFVATLAYDGAGFAGFQKAKEHLTVEGALERALTILLKTPPKLERASRTDRGVHARGQIVTFSAFIDDLRRFTYKLNSLLPPNMRVMNLRPIPSDFHPSLDAMGKEYHYNVCPTPIQLPFRRHISYHFPYPLSIDRMKEGAKVILDLNDFAAYQNQHPEKRSDTCCRIERIDIVEEGLNLRFEIEGNRFLYKMVRNIVGSLLYLGCGKIEDLNALKMGKREELGITAPAHGLTLMKIHYPKKWGFC